MKAKLLLALLLASCEPDKSLSDFKENIGKVATASYQLGLRDAETEIVKMEINGEAIDVRLAERRAIENRKRDCPWIWNEVK